MIFPTAVVYTARTLLETPYLHQGRLPGKNGGIDCIGVAIVTCNRLGLLPPGFDYSDYGRDGSGKLETIVAEYCTPLTAPTPGALLLFRTTPTQTVAQHCAICTDWHNETLGMLHAYQNVGKVKEHEFIQFWSDRLIGSYGFPNVIY
jgi:cell wall-associated NlpC family hydrolase